MSHSSSNSHCHPLCDLFWAPHLMRERFQFDGERFYEHDYTWNRMKIAKINLLFLFHYRCPLTGWQVWRLKFWLYYKDLEHINFIAILRWFHYHHRGWNVIDNNPKISVVYWPIFVCSYVIYSYTSPYTFICLFIEDYVMSLSGNQDLNPCPLIDLAALLTKCTLTQLLTIHDVNSQPPDEASFSTSIADHPGKILRICSQYF